MGLHDGQEGIDQLDIIDRQEAVNMIPDIWKNKIARRFYGHAIGDRVDVAERADLALLDRPFHRGGTTWLDADDFDFRAQDLGQCGHPGGQSTPTDRQDDGIGFRQISQDFKGDRPLTRSDIEIIERMDKGMALFLGQLQRMGIGFVIIFAEKDHRRAIGFRVIDLDQRRGLRHDDRGLELLQLGSQGNTLSMVASRCRDDQAALFLLSRQAGNLDKCTAYLVCTSQLQVFRLEIDLVAGQARVMAAVYERGFGDDRLQDLARLGKGIQIERN